VAWVDIRVGTAFRAHSTCHHSGLHCLLQLGQRAHFDLANAFPRDIILLRQNIEFHGVVLQPSFDQDLPLALAQYFEGIE
jgi:hypothetical protein